MATRTNSMRNLILLALVVSLTGCDGKTATEHLQLAREKVAIGEPRVATIELKNAIQKDPSMGQARALLGELHFLAGDLPSALKELERAIDLGVEDDDTKLYLLRTKNAMGRHSEVLGELEEQANLTPEYAVVLGNAYLIGGDKVRAKPLLEQGLHLADGLFGVAQVAQQENDLARAYSYLIQLTDTHPNHRQGWMFKGEIELQQNKAATALSSFTTGRSLPGGEITGQVGQIRAHLLADDLTAAQSEADALVKKAPEYPAGQYLKGLISFKQQDLDSSEAALRVVQQHARNHLPTLYLMGAVKAQQGKLNQAEDNLRRFLSQEGGNASVRKLLASIYNEQDKPEKVVEVLQPVVRQNSDPQLWAMLGSAQLRLGRMAQATEAFQRAVNLAPDMAPFRNQLALTLLSAGDDDQALAELSSAVELDKDQFQSDYILVMLKLRERDFEGAAVAVEQLIAKSSDVPLGYNLQGAIRLARGDKDGAVQAFYKALEIDPGYFPAAQNLARLSEQAGDVELAKQHYDKLLQADPQSESATLALVDLVVRQGDAKAGLAMLDSAITKFPTSIRAHVGKVRILSATGQLVKAEQAAQAAYNLAPEVPEILLLKADIDLRNGDTSEAELTAAKLQSLMGQYSDNQALLAASGALHLRLGNLTIARRNLELAAEGENPPASVAVSLARLELAEGNASGAQLQIDALKERGVEGEELDVLQGDTLIAAGQLDGARALFKSLADAGSRTGTSRYSLASLQAGELGEAKGSLQRWLAQNPDDRGMQVLLANVQIQDGDENAAKAQYEAMLPTNDPVVLNNLAWIYMGEHDERALDMARQAHAAAPNNPDIEDTLGWLLINNGDTTEGLELLKSSARARPDNPAVQYHLGVALQQSGDSMGAKQALQRAIDLGDFEELEKAKSALNSL